MAVRVCIGLWCLHGPQAIQHHVAQTGLNNTHQVLIHSQPQQCKPRRAAQQLCGREADRYVQGCGREANRDVQGYAVWLPL